MGDRVFRGSASFISDGTEAQAERIRELRERGWLITVWSPKTPHETAYSGPVKPVPPAVNNG